MRYKSEQKGYNWLSILKNKTYGSKFVAHN